MFFDVFFPESFGPSNGLLLLQNGDIRGHDLVRVPGQGLEFPFNSPPKQGLQRDAFWRFLSIKHKNDKFLVLKKSPSLEYPMDLPSEKVFNLLKTPQFLPS